MIDKFLALVFYGLFAAAVIGLGFWIAVSSDNQDKKD